MSKRFALVVGVDDYPGNPLTKCVKDARDIAMTLQSSEYGFQVTELIDAEVTRRRFTEYLNIFFREQADFYLLYFSGHGWSTDLGVHLVTIDADEIDQGISLDAVRNLIANVAPKNASVLLLLDCCHSGAALPSSLPETGIRVRAEDVLKSMSYLPEGRVLIAACRGDSVSYEDRDLPHSVFTEVLLTGLMGEAADVNGEVTVSILFDYIAREFREFPVQTPVFKGDVAGQMVLGRGFPAKLQPLAEEAKSEEIVQEAEKHLNEYQTKIASYYADLDGWRSVGHKAACQALTPILQWFDKVSNRYSDLNKDPRYNKSRLAVLNRLGSLCAIDIGMETVVGTVKSRIGSGTFGTVWRVDDGHSTVAFKVYHAQDLSVPEKMRRFRRGFDAMSQLDHPHIVRVQKFTEAPLGFVMDFIEGANLREFTGTLDDPRETLTLLLTIAETLKHAHNRGVVHRDVKPENILVSPDSTGKWRAYLTDFDLAWFSTASQFTKEGLGTWQYSAPEQLANPGSASAHAPTTDSYSFGQLAYYAITGSDPVAMEIANNQSHLERTIRDGWYADPAKAFLEMYSRCTQRRPEHRPTLETICLTLSKILQQLADISESTILSPAQFTSEVVFSMIGASLETRDFVSLSGKTQVRIRIKNQRGILADIDFEFEALVVPVIAGMSNFEQLRRLLSERIDRALGSGGNIRRRGIVGPWSTVIAAEGVQLNLVGLQQTRLLVSRVIDAFEGA